jgi:hypothetical protein
LDQVDEIFDRDNRLIKHYHSLSNTFLEESNNYKRFSRMNEWFSTQLDRHKFSTAVPVENGNVVVSLV